MSDITWREVPEKYPLRRIVASMRGPWPGQVLEQTKLLNTRMADHLGLGANRYVELEKAAVEQNLRTYARQIEADSEGRRAYRHAMRGTRGTL